MTFWIFTKGKLALQMEKSLTINKRNSQTNGEMKETLGLLEQLFFSSLVAAVPV